MSAEARGALSAGDTRRGGTRGRRGWRERRARVRGGDRLLGTSPLGPGHAGRRVRPLACALAALLAVLVTARLPGACSGPPARDKPTYPGVRSYLSEHLDPSLVGGARPGGAGAEARVGLCALGTVGDAAGAGLEDTGQLLYVRYTLADSASVTKGEGIDDVWSDPDHAAEAVWAQYETVANVYDPGGGDYLVALVDNTRLNGAGTVLDAAFAEHNTHGEEVDGVVYDRDSGVAYIPRRLYEQDGEARWHPLSAQLLVSYDFAADRTTVLDATLHSARADVPVVARRLPVEADAIDVTYTIPVVEEGSADRIALPDLAVYLGDSERPLALEEGVNARYDARTGELELLGSALTVSTLRVEVLPEGAADALVDAIATPATAYAADVGSLGMWPYGEFSNLDVSKVEEGQGFSYESPIKYDYNHDRFADIPWAGQMFAKTAPYVFTSFENAADDFSPGSSNWVFQQIKGGTTWDELRDHISSTPVSASPGDINFMFALPGDNSVGTSIGGLDWSGLESPIKGFRDDERYDTWIDAVAFCSHITQPDNHLTIDDAYNDERGTVTMRVLKIERGGSRPYVVMGFCSPQVSTQSGIAVIKFGIRSQGTLALEKSSANPDVVEGNPCYSLAGAEYAVYSDRGCTSKVGTLVTDERGSARLEGLVAGTYYVREELAPEGYLPDGIVREVLVEAGKVATVDVEETPVLDASWNLVQKLDAQLGQTPQGSASLAGARFEVSHYGVTDGSVEGKPLRTWVLESDSSGRVSHDTASVVEGDPYLTSSGDVVLPLGTYSIREISPPDGYLLTDGSVHVVVLEADDGVTRWRNLGEWSVVTAAGSFGGRGVVDDVARGGVSVTKLDEETGLSSPTGAADLAGTSFDITYLGEQPIVFEGKTLSENDLVTTIVAKPVETGDGGAFVAATDERALPVGRYAIAERAAGEGYVLGGYRAEFDVEADGQVVELAPARNPVRRGNLRFNKVDATTQQEMAGIPFLLTARSDSDGDGTRESHLAVTDANGVLHVRPGARSNASDDALREGADGSWEVDESRLDPGAGIWFSGRTDVETSPRESASALPYDTYDVEELPCSRNEGRRLVSFSVAITEDGVTVDRGTVENDEGPAISTSLALAGTDSKSVPAGETRLTDTVSYEGLERGATYELRGRLVDGDTGQPIVSEGGDEVSSTVSFSPDLSSGVVEVPFLLDASGLGGTPIVACEELVRDGEVVARHDRLDDAEQTVYVPAIGTSASIAGHRVSPSSGPITVSDLVTCSGLVPGESYVLEARLVYADSGDPVLSGNSEAISSLEFVAASPGETHHVDIAVDAEGLGGRTIVVMERLVQDGRTLATHEELDCADQTVSFAALDSSAADVSDGDRHIPASGDATVVDTVSYAGLEPGGSYRLVGTLVDAATGQPLRDGEGEALSSTVEFEVDDASGEVAVSFDLADGAERPSTIVSTQVLYEGGRELARHDSLDDPNQTITVPSLGTQLVDASDGDHEAVVAEKARLVDEVSYRGLEPGREYQLVGTLMDGETGEVLQDPQGAPVTVETSFTPGSPSGSEKVCFEFDASALDGREVVAFERLSTGGVLVATHEDLEDEGQTVHFVGPTGDAPGRVGVPKTGDGMSLPTLAALLGLGAALLAAGKRSRGPRGRARPVRRPRG